MSDQRAANLIAGLAVAPQEHVLDLGCGWGEFLLRVAESEPTCGATGIDADAEAIERGRRNKSDRRLDDRVTLEATAADFFSLASIVDAAMAAGYRVLSISEANEDEWDDFESRWCAGYERWLLANADHPEAPAARERVDDHRTRWLHGYGAVLGFAYLTLVAP
jgi:SAM-dependent methyltransferase